MAAIAGRIALGAVLTALAATAEPELPEGSPAAPPAPAAAAAVPAALPELAAPPEIALGLGIDPHARSLPPERVAAAAVPAPTVSLIERAWRTPEPDFDARIQRTRAAALALGAWSLDPAARALAAGGVAGGELERATAAVALAPDLPAAHMRLAEALWLQGDSPMAAIRAVVGALQASVRHVEASLWFGGSLLYLLAVALVGGGLLAIALAGIAALPHAAHDLGHLVSGATPDFARFAGLGAVLLVPLALGEGVLGLALVLLGVAVVYGARGQRVAMLLAVLGVALGVYPVVRLAGAALAVLPEDPVARAAYSVGHGIATPVEQVRLEAAADSDPLALRALAIQARRAGQLGEADALYQRLLAEGADDLVALNNAANVRLELGHMESALELYTDAVISQESPVLLFNLAQGYGRAFQVEDLNETLARAQSLGGDRIAQLTALQSADEDGFVVDYPLPRSLLWPRVFGSRAGAGLAAEFREPLAPGRLGRDPLALPAAGLAVLLLGSLLGAGIDPSRWCRRCGKRMCPRCDLDDTSGEVCEGCQKLFDRPEKTDRLLRLERVTALRAREQRVDRMAAIVSVIVPGAAGLLAQRPVLAWVGTLCFTLAAAALLFRDGVVPDPLVAGDAASLVFVGLAVLSGVIYAGVVATALASRRQG